MLDGADRVVRGARDLSAAGRGLADQRRGPGAGVEAASAARPWGHDDIGRTFDRHYRPVERQVLDAWAQLAAYVENLGEAAERSVGDGADDTAAPPNGLAAESQRDMARESQP